MSIRYSVYSFLSWLFAKELSQEDIAGMRVRVEALQSLPTALNATNKPLSEGITLLSRAVIAMEDKDQERVRLELATEYAGLFLGVRQRPPHPSESVYRSTRHDIMQKERDQVMSAYREMGFEKVKDFKEPEDHIALELDFMAALSKKAQDLLGSDNTAEVERYIRKQKAFLDEHLALWIDDLVKDIESSARIDFYLGAGFITQGFVKIDRTLLTQILEKLK